MDLRFTELKVRIRKDQVHVRIICFMLFSITAVMVNAQEFIGLAIDNYTPSNGMQLNPSVIVDQKPWLDIQVVGAGAHVTNNFGYIQNSTLLNISNYQNIGFNASRKNGWAQLNTQITGPSASLSLGKYAFGFHSAFRLMGNANKLPIPYAELYTTDPDPIEDSTVFKVNNTRVKSLGWGEIGLTAGAILYQFDKHLITGAITINRLLGLQSVALIIDEGSLMVVNNKGYLLDGNGKYGFANPGFTVGGGWSGSLGFTYKRMLTDISNYVPHGRSFGCHTLGYKWKVSGSIVDLGGIRIKRNSGYNKFTSEDDDDGDAYLNALESGGDFTGIPVDGSKYTAWLPVGINAQFDYNLQNGIFLNGLITQRASLASSYGPDRSNLIAVSARYERKHFMVLLPLSLENYQDPHLGLALRLSILTIGTENMLPFIVKSDIYTADIYFALRLRFYKAPGCKTKPPKGLENFKFSEIFRRTEKSLDACPDW
jgi:hypothetical protein